MQTLLPRYESLLILSPDYTPAQLKFLACYYAKTLRSWGASKIHIRYRGKRSLSSLIKTAKIADYIEIRFNFLPGNLENYLALIRLDHRILRSFLRKQSTKKTSKKN